MGSKDNDTERQQCCITHIKECSGNEKRGIMMGIGIIRELGE